jgi:hypothetical protein
MDKSLEETKNPIDSVHLNNLHMRNINDVVHKLIEIFLGIKYFVSTRYNQVLLRLVLVHNDQYSKKKKWNLWYYSILPRTFHRLSKYQKIIFYHIFENIFTCISFKPIIKIVTGGN